MVGSITNGEEAMINYITIQAARKYTNKKVIVVHNFDDKILLSKDFPKYAATVFKAMHPFILFLREAVKQLHFGHRFRRLHRLIFIWAFR